jgi:hypothetical protein
MPPENRRRRPNRAVRTDSRGTRKRVSSSREAVSRTTVRRTPRRANRRILSKRRIPEPGTTPVDERRPESAHARNGRGGVNGLLLECRVVVHRRAPVPGNHREIRPGDPPLRPDERRGRPVSNRLRGLSAGRHRAASSRARSRELPPPPGNRRSRTALRRLRPAGPGSKSPAVPSDATRHRESRPRHIRLRAALTSSRHIRDHSNPGQRLRDHRASSHDGPGVKSQSSHSSGDRPSSHSKPVHRLDEATGPTAGNDRPDSNRPRADTAPSRDSHPSRARATPHRARESNRNNPDTSRGDRDSRPRPAVSNSHDSHWVRADSNPNSTLARGSGRDHPARTPPTSGGDGEDGGDHESVHLGNRIEWRPWVPGQTRRWTVTTS